MNFNEHTANHNPRPIDPLDVIDVIVERIAAALATLRDELAPPPPGSPGPGR